jgi:hypothetical protein
MASRLRILALAAVIGVLAGCGGAGQASQRKKGDSAVLVVRCEVPDAEVWLNSKYFRTASELTRGVRLRPGSYRIEVRHSDFHSMYYDIELATKERRTIEVALARRFQ